MGLGSETGVVMRRSGLDGRLQWHDCPEDASAVVTDVPPRRGVGMSPSMPSAANGPLLLADISGYTSFLQSVAVSHRDDAFANGAVPDAYAMMSDLLDG